MLWEPCVSTKPPGLCSCNNQSSIGMPSTGLCCLPSPGAAATFLLDHALLPAPPAPCLCAWRGVILANLPPSVPLHRLKGLWMWSDTNGGKEQCCTVADCTERRQSQECPRTLCSISPISPQMDGCQRLSAICPSGAKLTCS